MTCSQIVTILFKPHLKSLGLSAAPSLLPPTHSNLLNPGKIEVLPVLPPTAKLTLIYKQIRYLLTFVDHFLGFDHFHNHCQYHKFQSKIDNLLRRCRVMKIVKDALSLPYCDQMNAILWFFDRFIPDQSYHLGLIIRLIFPPHRMKFPTAAIVT